jgi:ZPR1 zinc-finger domain
MFVPIGQVADDVLRAPNVDSHDAASNEQSGPPLRREINTADAIDRTGENGNPAAKLGEDEEGRPQVHRVEGDVMVIKSLCVQCEEDGLTRLLLTRIPFFRDVILMAFECEHCGFRSSELQSAEFQEKGCRFELKATGPEVSQHSHSLNSSLTEAS